MVTMMDGKGDGKWQPQEQERREARLQLREGQARGAAGGDLFIFSYGDDLGQW